MKLQDVTHLMAHPELLKTYHTGLMQAKAYRALKKHTRTMLQQYQLSTLDWALLGLLREATKGMRSLTIATDLGVEQPFVTVMLAKLKEKDLVTIVPDPSDGRAKLVTLTQKAKKLMPEIEKILRKSVSPLLQGASVQEVIMYVKVLEIIVANAKRLEE